MSTKHRAEVIEVYPDIGKCAVKFKYKGKERIECVRMLQNRPYPIGLKGKASYITTQTMGLWVFEPKEV